MSNRGSPKYENPEDKEESKH